MEQEKAMERNHELDKKQVTKENIPYETTDRKFENCWKLKTVLFKNKKTKNKTIIAEAQKHRRWLGTKEVEQDPVCPGQRHKNTIEALTQWA